MPSSAILLRAANTRADGRKRVCTVKSSLTIGEHAPSVLVASRWSFSSSSKRKESSLKGARIELLWSPGR